MTLNDRECKHSMQTIVKFGLNKAGISSTLHAVVRYGPLSLRGIGLFKPIVIQLEGGIAFLVEHFWKPTPSIPLLRNNLYNLQLEAVQGGHLL